MPLSVARDFFFSGEISMEVSVFDDSGELVEVLMRRAGDAERSLARRSLLASARALSSISSSSVMLFALDAR